MSALESSRWLVTVCRGGSVEVTGFDEELEAREFLGGASSPETQCLLSEIVRVTGSCANRMPRRLRAIGPYWSREEDDLLLSTYQSAVKVTDLLPLFPGRSLLSIVAHAGRLGLRRPVRVRKPAKLAVREIAEPAHVAYVCEARSKGKTLAAIGSELGLTRQRVHQVIKRYIR